ncbi:hypothetical protein [Actinoplanes regularis]|uniref:Excreted virulence factor EspC, type VII ESX diderm n=1 Tax=Actinoplanes regularis TaxID=52697 RepID=A0A239AR24_9ACTN|nr:hypothetical protein [Actinoplanes regularis]GIE87451.1 hypothetical protein Are01nite_39310 [Actinoplanes regularis]GLW30226.1 hypothetical protein Areg01_31660 [Actinoplanes regularis]SNR97448.1 hypothetical protein SAMN06264365_10832 [Actinoplanes regularis]
MANVEEVKTNIAVSVAGADRAITGIQVVSDQLDQSLALLRLTSVGSFHPAAVAAIAHLEQARTRLDEAMQLTRAAMDSANQFRSMI